MKALGYILICAGILYLIYAFNMDVSVETSSIYIPGGGSIGGGSVANLNLMAQRQNHLIVAALITLIGAMMAIFGKDESEGSDTDSESGRTSPEFSGARDLASDAYRLWLAKFYSIERNDVFDKFVMGDKTFDTLNEALDQAHEIEHLKNGAKAAEIERRKAQFLAEQEEARIAAEIADAEWQDQKPKILIGLTTFVILIAALYFILRETPEERVARIALVEAERMQKIEAMEDRFGVKLPKDAEQIEITENATNYDFFCDGALDGTLLEFQTNLSEEEIKNHIAKSLGKGKPTYEAPENFNWKWRKNNVRYELTMLNKKPIDVNLCMVR